MDHKTYFKTNALRSKRYLNFIRSKPCLNCSAVENIQAAHVSFKNRGTGIKAPDSQTLPLCHFCHTEEHRPGNFWKNNNIDPKVEIIKLLTEFITLNVKG